MMPTKSGLRNLGLGGALLAALAVVPASAQTRREPPGPWPGPLMLLPGLGSSIGVSVRDLDRSEVERLKLTGGAIVDEVRRAGPAESAGFRRSDVVTDFDGETVRSARQLARLVQETPPGRSVRARVLRDGKRIDLEVTPESGGLGDTILDRDRLRERLGDAGVWLDRRGFRFDVPALSGVRLGVTVQDLTPQLAEYFGARDGLLVSSVADDSPAARGGLKAGDVIVSANGRAVRSRADLTRELAEADQTVAIGVVREKRETSLSIQLDRAGTRPGRPPRRARPISV